MFPQGAWPCAAGVTGRRPEGTEPAREQWVGGRLGHMPWVSALWEGGSGPWYYAVYELSPQVTDQIHPSHPSSWTPAGSTMSLQENPQVTSRDGFGEGWRVHSISEVEMWASGLSHQQGRAL